MQSQAVDLKRRPDIVICTPGRIIDHVTNTMSVDLDDVEVVILDEADRLMDLGFQDEVGKEERKLIDILNCIREFDHFPMISYVNIQY